MEEQRSLGWLEAEFDQEGLRRLFGLAMAKGSPIDLVVDGSAVRPWRLQSTAPHGDEIEQVWTQGEWEFRSRYARLGVGALLRSDLLLWRGAKPATLRRCHSRFGFEGGAETKLEWIASAWAREGQVEHAALHHGDIVLRHVSGRTSDGTSPYLAVDAGGQRVALHLAPVGNWTIRARHDQFEIDAIRPSVSLGLSDENLRLVLEPGETLNLPQVLITADEPAALHRAWLTQAPLRPVPVIYNTWYYRYDDFNLDQLQSQLEAAKRIGCEVFVVDAGWFGKWKDGNWPGIGDWVETQNGAFDGKMAYFADAVRASGMGFGLWIEPERFGKEAQIRIERPEWFPDPDMDFSRILLEVPEARTWVRYCIAKLVEQYDLAWFKIDFNFSLGDDRSGRELMPYYEAWNGLIDELRTQYPKTLFEACSSGAMRLDLEVMRHYPVAYLSDNVNPWDMLSIAHGTWRRVPPGRIGRWAVMKRDEDGVRASVDANWHTTEAVSVEFDAAVAFTGCMGFSGDLASLGEESHASLADLVRAYKDRRQKIQDSAGYLLTGDRRIGDRFGWVVTQQQHGDWNLIAGYRLKAAEARFLVQLRGLDPDARYTVRSILGEATLAEAMGRELMDGGLFLAAPSNDSATLVEVFEAGANSQS